jgi:hypothetical protein
MVEKQPSWNAQNVYKNSNVAFIRTDAANAVLLAAVDWKNYQSLENANALYLAVIAMLGETPQVPYELD